MWYNGGKSRDRGGGGGGGGERRRNHSEETSISAEQLAAEERLLLPSSSRGEEEFDEDDDNDEYDDEEEEIYYSPPGFLPSQAIATTTNGSLELGGPHSDNNSSSNNQDSRKTSSASSGGGVGGCSSCIAKRRSRHVRIREKGLKGIIRNAKFRWHSLSRKQKGCAVCGGTTALILSAILLIYFLVVPAVISSYASQAIYTFRNVTMTGPSESSLYLYCLADILMNMPVSAETGSAMASFQFNGSEVGRFRFSPILFPQGNHTTVVSQYDVLEISNLELFRNLAQEMVFAEESVWTLEMTGVTVWAIIPGGLRLPFFGVNVKTDIVVPGMGGLKNVELIKYDVLLNDKNEAISYVAVNIKDTSVINVSPVGTVTMDVYVLGAIQASLTLESIQLLSGDNILVGIGPVNPKNETILTYVFDQYLNGRNVSLTSVATGCSIPLYDSVFRGLKVDYVLQGNDATTNPLVLAALMELDVQMVLDGIKKGELDVPAQLYLHYQFTAPITFTHFELNVLYNGTALGGYYGDVVPPMILPGNSKYLTRALPIKAYLQLSYVPMFLMAIAKELGKGMVPLGLSGSMRFHVGNVVAEATTMQPPIPTCNPVTKWMCGVP